MLNAERARPGAGHGFERAAVVGAGLMGRGIAGVLAAGGLDVVLYDVHAHVLADALESIRISPAATAGTRTGGRATDGGAGDGAGAGGRATDGGAGDGAGAGGHGQVTGSADLAAAVSGADLIVEAVIEDLAVKREVFAQVSAAAPAAVLATNTSVLPVSAIAETAHRPERVIGTHWWNPPDLIPVVEVIPGPLTSAGTADRVMTLLAGLGKTPVLLRRDGPGFIGNRLQHALWREAIALVADGISDAETVDLVARNTIGLRLARMGPLENADYVGLDLTIAIHDTVLPALSRDREPSPLLGELVRRGDLGAKTGRGFLDWGDGERQAAARELAAHVAGQVPSGSTRCRDPFGSRQPSSHQ